MSKSIYDEALKRMSVEFDAWDRAERFELFGLLEQALEQAQKQEKLLDLYKEALEELSWVSQTARGNYVNNIEPELTKQIKEIENENE